MTDATPKKPPTPVSIDDHAYLKAHVRNLLQEAHDLDQQRDVIHEKIREFTRILRQKNGNSVWAPLAWAVSLGVVLVVIAAKTQPKTFIYQEPQTDWRVLRRFNSKSFRMQQVEQGNPLPPVVMNSCTDLPWEAGIVLRRFEYDYADSCFTTGTLHPERWYSLVRNGDGCPIVPANCHHTTPTCAPATDHILCNGEPQF